MWWHIHVYSSFVAQHATNPIVLGNQTVCQLGYIVSLNVIDNVLFIGAAEKAGTRDEKNYLLTLPFGKVSAIMISFWSCLLEIKFLSSLVLL